METYNPDENQVTTQDGNTTTYEYLIVATGFELRYDMIPGSAEALDDPECPVGSMYQYDYAMKMRSLRSQF